MSDKSIDSVTDETEVKAAELAQVLGISHMRVHQLKKDGIIQNSRRGRFRLAEAVQKYIRYRLGKPASEEDLNTEKQKLEAEALLKASKARIAKMEADELEGSMHRSEDVAAMTEDLIYTIRAMLTALPGRLAADVSASASTAETSDIIRKEIYAVMNALSNYKYDPAKYEQRARQRRKWEAREREEDEE